MFLAYDIKGIQKYIFAVPRLKCIVGGSLLIAEFDKTEVDKILSGVPGSKKVYSGGGRGLIEVSNETDANALKEELIDKAHDLGLDIRIGIKDTSPEAADLNLYPFIPEVTIGNYLCGESGLYPVDRKGETHEIIKKRLGIVKKKVFENLILDEMFEKRILDNVLTYLPEDCQKRVDVRFFRNVDAEDGSEEPETRAAVNALGNRNRWALIYMDGNDMGRQYKSLPDNLDKDKRINWQCDFSKYLDCCTRTAFYKALAATIEAWLKSKDYSESCYYDDQSEGKKTLVLPFRPLILGGDDVAMLCHSGFALDFVKAMSKEFTAISQEQANQYKGAYQLWPATGNMLTISAGILYCKTKFPLALAMTYAESLLSSAKGAFRSKSEGVPTPPAVDFDTITDSLVDSPAERRKRELRFTDPESNTEVFLTRRPYLLFEGDKEKSDVTKNALSVHQLEEDYIKLLKEDLKTSIRADILPGLRQPWSLRTIFLASLAKNHPNVKARLWEPVPGEPTGSWWNVERSEKKGTFCKTAVIDALLLLDEQRRMDQDTVNASNEDQKR